MTNRFLATATAAALLILAVSATTAAAASSTVECGQLTGYTAPDPVTPTNGSLKIGLLETWDVLATATVSTDAAAALPSVVNAAPTCLALDFDEDGKVSAIDFAPTGTITGTVGFDAPYYVFADRLIIPTDVTDAQPGLEALFATSYAAGTSLSVTFTVDKVTGQFVGFDGTAAFCGAGSVTKEADGQVGKATIPAAVLDADDLDDLAGADGADVCASVHSSGSVKQGGDVTVATDVVITVTATATPTPADPTSRPAPTLPPTSTISPVEPGSAPGVPAFLVIAAAFSAALIVAGRRSRVRSAR